jgi:hypothetical protein
VKGARFTAPSCRIRYNAAVMPLLRLLLIGCLALCAARAEAQTPATPVPAPQAPAALLRVYLDCGDCFAEYLRTEIKWVDFVRQREDADVHLLSSSRETGGGGREIVLRFVGAGRFQGINHELRVLSLTGDPEDVRRRNVLRTVLVGFLGYVARLGLPSDLNVSVRPAVDAAAQTTRDPWNFWVFELSARGSIDAEESNRQWNWDFNASADRVTEAWKISFGAGAEDETERFNLDEDDPFTVKRRERSFNYFLAKSLGEHWSVGLDGDLESSTFGNTQFSGTLAPTVEFSVFPYSQYAVRQLRLQYSIGAAHARYNEITLFDKLRETLGRHEFSVRLDQRQPWGSLEAGVEFSQYLHDFSKFRLEVDGDISVRLTRGLSLSMEGSASRVRDQLSLPRRDATPEEVLLRLRELQSGYEVSFNIGLSYTFGSIFNNVVNPRFGG